MFFDKHNLHMLRILLTDSGQYILPIDGQYETPLQPLQQQQQDNVHFYMKNIYSQSREQWTDLHSNVDLLFQYNQTSRTALMEPEQGEPKQSDIDVTQVQSTTTTSSVTFETYSLEKAFSSINWQISASSEAWKSCQCF